MRFLFVPKHEKMAWWKAMLVKRESHRRNCAYFAKFDKPYFLDDLKNLEYRWTKCIKLQEDYIAGNLRPFRDKQQWLGIFNAHDRCGHSLCIPILQKLKQIVG